MTAPGYELTPDGLPFPGSDDDLNQGANAIKALAVALDERGAGRAVRIGYQTVRSSAANGRLTFPEPFAADTVPLIMLNANVPNVVVFPAVGAPSATGCQITFVRLWPGGADLLPGDVDVTVTFLAIGQA